MSIDYNVINYEISVLCGGFVLLSMFDYSVWITCPFSLATSAVLLGIIFGGQKIINRPKQ
jgi:hypothetical protein